MDTDAAADELYGLLPEQFTSRRSELSTEARQQGDAAARAQLAAMRRPTVAAWAVNLLVRERSAEVQNLLRVAAELRAAQRALDGNRLRELSLERRTCVAELGSVVRSVTAAAGRPVNDAVLREVQATLDAAVADENAEAAVRTGRLTTALNYSGFGEVDISAAVAASDARPRLAVVRSENRASAPQGPGAHPTGRAQAQGEASVPRRAAGSADAVAARERDVEQARSTLAEVTARRDELLADAEQLRRQLNDVEQQLRPTEAQLRSARRRLETAKRVLSHATGRHTRNRET
ncbi:MAG: hypothetical protein M3N95_02690 [Actinomycetota bacterium]|nr:hypothetical protein [Actinomycetota bacterium]